MGIKRLLRKKLKKAGLGKRLKAFKKGPRKDAPPKIKKWIRRNNHHHIRSIVVCRKPIQSTVKKMLNVISIGNFSKGLKELPYEDVFHLYLYINVGGKWKKIEKNEVVVVLDDEPDDAEECVRIEINKGLTLQQLFDNSEYYQESKFWNYHPKRNNCQTFASSILIGNGLIESGDETHKFVKQDAFAIYKSSPKFLGKLSKMITDLAGTVDRVKEGG